MGATSRTPLLLRLAAAILLLLAASNVLFGLGRGDLGPYLSGSVVLALLAAVACFSARSAVPSDWTRPPNHFWKAVAGFFATGLVLYAVFELVLGLLFHVPPFVGSGALTLVFGAALFAWALRSVRPAKPAEIPPFPGQPVPSRGTNPASAPSPPEPDLLAVRERVRAESRKALIAAADLSQTFFRVNVGMVLAIVLLDTWTLLRFPNSSSWFTLLSAAPLFLLVFVFWQKFRSNRNLVDQLDAGELPDGPSLDRPPIVRIWHWMRNSGDERRGPGVLASQGNAVAYSIGVIDVALKMVKRARASAYGLSALAFFVGGAAAYLGTFLLLLEFRGGGRTLPQDAFLALLAGGVVALLSLLLLRRLSQRIDRIERRLLGYQLALQDLERQFWARF